MVIVAPFHTLSTEYSPSHREVYHDRSECKYGARILPKDRLPGTGSRERCAECLRLGRVRELWG